MMSLWDALRMNMMISYQELVRTFLSTLRFIFYDDLSVTIAAVHQAEEPHAVNLSLEENIL